MIVILADDLGWKDLGCYGSTAIRTPNLDRLAAEGLRFTHGYAGSPWCSSTRISLYTGRYPGRLPAGLEEPLVTRSEGHGIPADHPTLPSLLAGAGHRTAMFGKWHCGWLPWYSPLRIGFQTFFGNLDGALDYFEHVDTLGRPDLYEGETPVEQVGYYTDLISDRAAEYVAADHGAPFYLQLNYTAPHWPWEGPGDSDVGRDIRARYDREWTRSPLMHLDGGSVAKYGELVEAMDAGIGRVLNALAAAGRSDNTIVVFTSDNGGERWSKNWPFVGEKGDLTEGGIRVPLLLRWPAALAPGQESDQPVVTMDLTATLLDACGVEPALPLDGVSLAPWLLDGGEFPAHDLFWRTSNQGALRRGRFKYLYDRRDRAVLGNWPRHVGEYHLLYDVTVDGRERADLAGQYPDVLAELRAEWERLNAEQLPFPPDHPGLPRWESATGPAVSESD
ncbi:n-acetylgalactosamine-6-sulfate sulfatase [Saccharomonospora azurea SZMC 14600]|uniref:sulfatase family protein n=1 Tax=Saccharomonospora azurea TaxID=40988 RepID=UPI000240034B|nr:sulfatase-like hydrolase/transferase [Saccharomonospora azurea]EHK89351.1 n-acetylgalactosamine-6-sulfate sulfatase [Saccharomonospora azurea SZMC 14600]